MNEWLSQVPLVPLVAVVGLVVVFLVFGRGGSKKSSVVAEKIAAGAKIVDVRSKGEYAGGHYPGAINVPVDALSGKLKTFGPLDTPIVVYCAAGSRAGAAAAQLRAAGYTDVTNAGGLSSMPQAPK